MPCDIMAEMPCQTSREIISKVVPKPPLPPMAAAAVETTCHTHDSLQNCHAKCREQFFRRWCPGLYQRLQLQSRLPAIPMTLSQPMILLLVVYGPHAGHPACIRDAFWQRRLRLLGDTKLHFPCLGPTIAHMASTLDRQLFSALFSPDGFNASVRDQAENPDLRWECTCMRPSVHGSFPK